MVKIALINFFGTVLDEDGNIRDMNLFKRCLFSLTPMR